LRYMSKSQSKTSTSNWIVTTVESARMKMGRD
jgi:hypothetical protein